MKRSLTVEHPIAEKLKTSVSVNSGGKSEIVPLRPQEQKAPKACKPYVPENYESYELPPLDLLAEPEFGYSAVQGKVVKSKAAILEQLLSEFKNMFHEQEFSIFRVGQRNALREEMLKIIRG